MRNEATPFIYLTVILSILVPVGVTEAFSGAGSGTEEDPYIITNIYELQEINNNLFDAWYELGNDIDASVTKNWNSGEGFIPVSGLVCERHINGKNHTISGLYINRPSANYHVGLFKDIALGSEVKNIVLINADVRGNEVVGSLIGYNNQSTVTNCYSIGNVGGNEWVGGLVGYNYYGVITNCYFTGDVNGGSQVGGVVGRNYYGTLTTCSSTGNISGDSFIGGLGGVNDGTIINCYSTGGINGNDQQIGGLIGRNCSGGTITDTYSTVSVSGNLWTGGLVGINRDTITNSYSAGRVEGTGDHVGGLVGETGWECSDCFWDVETSGQTTSACGTGKTTAEMRQQATFTNWDFENIWDIIEEQTCPFFKGNIGLQIWKTSEPMTQCSGGPIDPLGKYWYEKDFDDSSWQDITIPDIDSFSNGNDRFYRAEFFSIPELAKTKIWFQSDDGIWIYVNGDFVGHWGSECGGGCCVNCAGCGCNEVVAPVDITSYLHEGDNVFAVMVNNGYCCNSYFYMSLLEIPLPTRIFPYEAAELAKEVIGKDYRLEHGNPFTKGYKDGRFVSSSTIEYLDCSGLSFWSFNRAYYGEATITWEEYGNNLPLLYEGADGQYRHNSYGITREELRPGDLLFFDIDDDPRMDHVAMYVGGPFELTYADDEIFTYNTVEATTWGDYIITVAFYDTLTGKITTLQPSTGQTRTLTVDGYGRVKGPKKSDIQFIGKSPINLIITNPEGITITQEIGQVPGMYYRVYDIDEDGKLDDIVDIPEREVGDYQITVVPEPNALPDDTYSLEAVIEGQTMVLAEDVQIQDIPAEPYIFESKLNRSDFDTDGDVDYVDLDIFVLHWLAEDCNYPSWCEGTDLNYNHFVDFRDFAIFAENWLWEKIPADLDIDGDVDFFDYAFFAKHWMDVDCNEPDWCSGADLNKSGYVDLYDLAEFAEHWLEGK